MVSIEADGVIMSSRLSSRCSSAVNEPRKTPTSFLVTASRTIATCVSPQSIQHHAIMKWGAEISARTRCTTDQQQFLQQYVCRDEGTMRTVLSVYPKSANWTVVFLAVGDPFGAMNAAEPQSDPPHAGAGRNGWKCVLWFAKYLKRGDSGLPHTAPC